MEAGADVAAKDVSFQKQKEEKETFNLSTCP
jgi:hypothetical protein